MHKTLCGWCQSSPFPEFFRLVGPQPKIPVNQKVTGDTPWGKGVAKKGTQTTTKRLFLVRKWISLHRGTTAANKNFLIFFLDNFSGHKKIDIFSILGFGLGVIPDQNSCLLGPSARSIFWSCPALILVAILIEITVWGLPLRLPDHPNHQKIHIFFHTDFSRP